MTRPFFLGLALLAAGGQGGITAAVVVRAPGAPPGDSAAVANAVKQALVDAKIEVLDRGPDAKAGPGRKGARYYVEVTAKVMGASALVDERVIDAESTTMVARVAVRTATPAMADSAAAAARRLAGKLAEGKSRKPGG